MPDYLVEFYMARIDGEEFAAAAERAKSAAGELAREGESVVCLRAIFVPEDETCFLIYRAGSPAIVHEAMRRAQLPSERPVTPVVTVGKPEE